MEFELLAIEMLAYPKLFQRYDKLQQFLAGAGNLSLDYDDYHQCAHSSLECVSEFMQCHCSENQQSTCYYFSDTRMMDFYRLCREYSRINRLKLKDNPYMRDAYQFVREQLSLNSYCYGYNLHTKLNHHWASGIAFFHDDDFDYLRGFYYVAEAMLEIFDYYGYKANELRQITQEARLTNLIVISRLEVAA